MNPIAKTSTNEEEQKYQHARNDLLQAYKSFSDLTPQNQEMLVYEMFEITAAHAVSQTMQQQSK